MAKTASKRKSESALPTGKSKHRKTSDHRADASDSAGNVSEDNLFVGQEPAAPEHVKKSSRKSRKSEPVKRSARADEYEEDEGRLDSKPFLALYQFEINKKQRAKRAATQFMDKFECKIDDAEVSLKKRIEDLGIEASKQDADFNESFQDAYAASRPLPPTAKGESQAKGMSKDISFATLYDRSLEIIEGARLIIDKFETASKITSKVETAQLMDNDWGEDNERAAEILAAGYKVGLERYKSKLVGSNEPDIDEEDSAYAGQIYPDTEDHTSIPWGTIAKKGEKTMRKLVKAIMIEVV